MKTVQIQEVLISEYMRLRPFVLTNYSGVTGYEADVIMINSSMSAYEYEIKTSRADFLKDFKKISKHNELSNPSIKKGRRTLDYPLCPNYFYYVCVEDLIKEHEVPSYAGLIYIVDNKPKVIKKGKKLHSFKVSDRIMRNICRTLSARFFHGCAFSRYRHKSK